MDPEGAMQTSAGSGAHRPNGEVHDAMATDPAVLQTSGSRDRRYALVVLALLCLAYVLNFLDPDLALARRLGRDRDVISTQARRGVAAP